PSAHRQILPTIRVEPQHIHERVTRGATEEEVVLERHNARAFVASGEQMRPTIQNRLQVATLEKKSPVLWAIRHGHLDVAISKRRELRALLSERSMSSECHKRLARGV